MTVDVDGHIRMPVNWTSIPIQFNIVSSDFSCAHTKITSLKGAPRYVGGNCLSQESLISTLEHAPLTVGEDFLCYETPYMRSLHGVEKWIPNIKIGGAIYVDQTHLLGLALIEGINSVAIWKDEWITFDISHHDPFQFQGQLLEQGFTEQAQL